MKRPMPLLRFRFELRGQALKSMAQIIETQEQEISTLKFRIVQKDQIVRALQARIDKDDRGPGIRHGH